jgi:hypothetical protein
LTGLAWGELLTAREGPNGSAKRPDPLPLSSPADQVPERFGALAPFPIGGWDRYGRHRSPEASLSHAVRLPERLTERCCSFGVRDWRSRNSPARERYGPQSTSSRACVSVQGHAGTAVQLRTIARVRVEETSRSCGRGACAETPARPPARQSTRRRRPAHRGSRR